MTEFDLNFGPLWNLFIIGCDITKKDIQDTDVIMSDVIDINKERLNVYFIYRLKNKKL